MRRRRQRPERSVIEAILPVGARVAEEFGARLVHGLYPEEEAVVADAAPRRREEFAAVRRCARRALEQLGRPPAPVLPGPGGAPVWPGDVVGSMTHCAGYRAAVVADRSTLATIGIDAEPDEPLPVDVVRVIARPEEIALFHAAGSVQPFNGDRLLFSAKEAVYKAWYPLTGRWLDFDDVSVLPDPHARRFTARVLAPAPDDMQHFSGTWTVASGLILTVCVHGAWGDPPRG